ncbi:hypothetical protein ACWC0A_17975 [Streptomyces scopuliridis]
MPFTHDAQEDVATWLRANRIDPMNVPDDSAITVSSKADGTRVIQYAELQRDVFGRILADPHGDPVTKPRETALITTATPDTEPWALGHNLTVHAQTRTRPGPAGEAGARWTEHEYTGLVLAVCNCGLNTGWISRGQMPGHEVLADVDQHAALIAEGWGRALRDPANRESVSVALRTEARVNPEWIRDVIRREERMNGGKPCQV